jgi:hypothetical protein
MSLLPLAQSQPHLAQIACSPFSSPPAPTGPAPLPKSATPLGQVNLLPGLQSTCYSLAQSDYFPLLLLLPWPCLSTPTL